MGGACSTYGGREMITEFRWGNLKVKTVGRPERRWEDNI
jgi:hypothetical protein